MAPPKTFVRPRDDRYLAGVCSAIARRFGIDVTIVRVLWVLAVLVFGFGFLLYLIFWIVIPSE